MSAAPSIVSPGFCLHRSPPWAGCSRIEPQSAQESAARRARSPLPVGHDCPIKGTHVNDPCRQQQLARFVHVGHRNTGDRRLRCSRGAGYEKAYVAIDDATRLA
jgi:hypothetical protein